jgi:hypothetical protein
MEEKKKRKAKPETFPICESEQRMKNATIGRDTRELLIISGKLTDIEDELMSYMTRIYGEEQTDRIYEEGYSSQFSEIQSQIIIEIGNNISNAIYSNDGKQI